MNRLVIIGNGFDMAHGLKTSYMDFINWYWDQRVNSFWNVYTNLKVYHFLIKKCTTPNRLQRYV